MRDNIICGGFRILLIIIYTLVRPGFIVRMSRKCDDQLRSGLYGSYNLFISDNHIKIMLACTEAETYDIHGCPALRKKPLYTKIFCLVIRRKGI